MIVHSFDVFDTCLMRRVPEPSAVFYDVARRVFLRRGMVWTAALAEDFVAARISAERGAREQSNREDTTLIEIWQRLCLFMDWEIDPSLAECELAAEEAVLIPIPIVRTRVNASRLQGARIIFVSDMYLPGEFIRRQLIRHHIAESGDPLYLSSETGLLKSTGNLFRRVITEEKITPAEIFHFGDNPHTDYNSPRKLGIQAELFTGSRLTAVERSVAEAERNSRGGVSIAGAMREFRLTDTEQDEGLKEVVAEFVAPFVIGFATWLLRRAQEKGLKRLYFMSRDCQLTWKVARELAPQFGIDCRYLYVSRQALFLPSAQSVSPEGMPWMKKVQEDSVLSRLLAKIELTYDDVKSSLGLMVGTEEGSYRLQSDKDWETFWQALKEERIETRVKELISSRRRAALDYFASVGLLDPEAFAIVDLGWALTCQHALRNIIRHTDVTGEILGLYLELTLDRIPRASSGNAESLFYQTPADVIARPMSLADDRVVLEHLVGSADHTTVHHYEDARPIFIGAIEPIAADFSKRLHAAVLRFVGSNPALAGEFLVDTDCRRILRTLQTSFTRSPTKSTAMTLSEILVSGDQNNLDEQNLVRPFTLTDALLPLLPGGKGPLLNRWKARQRMWAEGSRVITPPAILWMSDVAMRLREKLKRLR